MPEGRRINKADYSEVEVAQRTTEETVLLKYLFSHSSLVVFMVFSGWCNTVSMEGKVGRIVDTEPDGEFEMV